MMQSQSVRNMSNKTFFSEIRVGTVTKWLACLVIGVAVLAVVLLPPFIHWNQQNEAWLAARSTTADTVSLSPGRALDGLAAYYKLNEREDRPATLQLSLDEKDLQDLTARRNDALVQGWITSKHKQQLPAALIVDGRRMNASVRLRGNQLDHVSGDKWSLKIYLKQGARFNGIRRFSLQAPYTRSFQSEAIIADAMRSVGVLAPRIDYVDLVINGDHIGIMQMTEEFDTPLLETQGRRFGPLLQLDDSHTWEMVRTTERYAQISSHKSNQNNNNGNNSERFDKSAWWNLYSSWRSADPKAYGKYNKRKKREDLDAALSKWMAFTDNQVIPSDIFDIDTFVDFYIMCEYFTAHNLAQWPNARLHYNTLTARFEPIAYDADVNFKPMHNAPLTCLNPRNEFARTLMQDHTFASHWVNRIRELDKKITSDQFANTIAERDRYYRKKLAADYPWLPAFDFRKVQRQCQRLCGLTIDNFALPIAGRKPLPEANSIPLNELPPVVKVYLTDAERGSILSLRNRIHANVVVSSLAYENRINEQLVPLIGQSETGHRAVQLPVNLRSIPVAVGTNSKHLDSTPIEIAGATLTEDDTLSLQVIVEGLGTQHTALKPVPLPQHTAIPQPTPVEKLVQRYPFLTLDESGKTLQVETGQWPIGDLVILPRDIALVIDAGTQLLFESNAGLVLNGDLTVRGTASAPVLFDAADTASGWYGIFSHGVDNRLLIQHATINATRGFEMPGWRQPAGLLFHRANLVLENVAVTNSCANDAINLIRSKVTIKNLQVSNSCSDALDIDASIGTLSMLNLHQSGGDLLDFSESTVSLNNSVFSGAGDKAISVGEASDVEVSEVTITKSTIGLAVKDFSKVTINKAILTLLDIGIMAFQKKAEYGPAFIVGSNIKIDAVQRYVLEELSGIALEGMELPVTPFDLSEYY